MHQGWMIEEGNFVGNMKYPMETNAELLNNQIAHLWMQDLRPPTMWDF